ncbi:hypothetical protein Ahy_B09g099324 [Arachis hypogaea]|nr:hypothetical protein Ahy_B09g099324 [Arachis hypogaea]
MNSSTKSFILFSLGLVLIIANVAQAEEKSATLDLSKLVIKVCDATATERAKCMDIMRSNPKMLSAKNIVQLSQAILELGISKGKEGQKFLKELAKKSKSPALEQCAGFDYDGVVGSFKSALGEIKEDPMTANYDAKVASDGPDTCDRGLESEKIVNPAITELNKEIRLLSGIAFAATNFIPNKI